MIDLIDTMVVWNTGSPNAPGDKGERVPGAVAAVRHPDTAGRYAGYERSDLACNVSDWKLRTPEQRQLLLHVLFGTLVIRDGLSPAAVHEAFLGVKEYVAVMPLDVPGVAALA